jgi:hypothetical protein
MALTGRETIPDTNGIPTPAAVSSRPSPGSRPCSPFGRSSCQRSNRLSFRLHAVVLRTTACSISSTGVSVFTRRPLAPSWAIATKRHSSPSRYLTSSYSSKVDRQFNIITPTPVLHSATTLGQFSPLPTFCRKASLLPARLGSARTRSTQLYADFRRTTTTSRFGKTRRVFQSFTMKARLSSWGTTHVPLPRRE